MNLLMIQNFHFCMHDGDKSNLYRSTVNHIILYGRVQPRVDDFSTVGNHKKYNAKKA